MIGTKGIPLDVDHLPCLEAYVAQGGTFRSVHLVRLRKLIHPHPTVVDVVLDHHTVAPRKMALSIAKCLDNVDAAGRVSVDRKYFLRAMLHQTVDYRVWGPKIQRIRTCQRCLGKEGTALLVGHPTFLTRKLFSLIHAWTKPRGRGGFAPTTLATLTKAMVDRPDAWTVSSETLSMWLKAVPLPLQRRLLARIEHAPGASPVHPLATFHVSLTPADLEPHVATTGDACDARDARDAHGRTWLHLACDTSKTWTFAQWTEAMAWPVSKSVLHTRDAWGRTPLMYAVKQAACTSSNSTTRDRVRALLDAGGRVTDRDVVRLESWSVTPDVARWITTEIVADAVGCCRPISEMIMAWAGGVRKRHVTRCQWTLGTGTRVADTW